MKGTLSQLALGVGVVALAIAPVLVAPHGPLLTRHLQSLAQFGGRLVEYFHGITMRPTAGEVKA